YQKPNDQCILSPKKCSQGISFSIWEKVFYDPDVFDDSKSQGKHYIFSTGGDYDYSSSKAYPGLALYHQGMDTIAVVSTGDDIWELRVTGQLMNDSWSNIGVRWEPNIDDPTLDIDDRGGLEVNRTVDETLFFMGGYMSNFQEVDQSSWFVMMNRLDLADPAQAAVAAYITSKFSTANTSQANSGSSPGSSCTSIMQL
ncbi:unnamed protein product, partial [Sphagnum tenellum]